MIFTIINIVYNIVHVYSGIIFIYCIFSWFPSSNRTGIIADIKRILSKIVDPYLGLFRRFIPPIGGVVDASPIIAIIVLEGIAKLLIELLVKIL